MGGLTLPFAPLFIVMFHWAESSSPAKSASIVHDKAIQGVPLLIELHSSRTTCRNAPNRIQRACETTYKGSTVAYQSSRGHFPVRRLLGNKVVQRPSKGWYTRIYISPRSGIHEVYHLVRQEQSNLSISSCSKPGELFLS